MPGEHVARPAVESDGRPRAQTQTPRPGAATRESSPLSTTTQSNRSAASCTEASRCAATSLRLAPEQARELALVRGEDARRRPLAGLELEQRVGVDHRRQLHLREQAADERLRLRLASEAGTDRERLGLRRRLEDVLERPLHRLQHERLEHRQRLGRRRDRHVAGVGAEGGAGGERRPLRSCRASRRPRGRGPPCTCCRRGERRGTSARISGVTSRCSVSAGSRPMSATATSPAWKRPGATASPTFGPCIVTVTSARTAAPATSPVDAFTPEGMSTATTGTPAAVDLLDQP